MSNKHPVNGFDKRPRDINYTGRPKKEESLTNILKGLAEGRTMTIDGTQYSYKEALGLRLWNIALEGDMTAIRYLFDRVDGSCKASLTIEDGQSDKLSDLLNMVSEMHG